LLVLLEIPPTAVGGSFKSFLQTLSTMIQSRQRKLADRSGPYDLSGSMNRSDLKDPPTAVGGIENALGARSDRKDLNNPPTAVGGIENALGCKV